MLLDFIRDWGGQGCGVTRQFKVLCQDQKLIAPSTKVQL